MNEKWNWNLKYVIAFICFIAISSIICEMDAPSEAYQASTPAERKIMLGNK